MTPGRDKERNFVVATHDRVGGGGGRPDQINISERTRLVAAARQQTRGQPKKEQRLD
jgi:hypothetical protein